MEGKRGQQMGAPTLLSAGAEMNIPSWHEDPLITQLESP